MILGIGCDIVEINRFASWSDKKVKRFFTPNEFKEISFDLKRRNERLACKFALKESFSKAIGVSLFSLALTEIEVLSAAGIPVLNFYGRVLKIYMKLGSNLKIHATLSHEHHNAIAFLIIER